MIFGHFNDDFISPPTKAMKFCSPGHVSIIRCDDINHPNECTVVLIKFGAIMPKKPNVALINAVLHDIAAHCSLFPSQGMDLLPANTKHCIQLHLLTTSSVLNAATAMIVSINANNMNDVTFGEGHFLGSGGHHGIKNT